MSPPRPHPLYIVAASIFVLLVLSLQMVRVQGHLESAGRLVGIVSTQAADGLLIDIVTAGGAAARGGLQPGDVLISIDGRDVASHDDYDQIASGFSPQRVAVFEVMRAGSVLALEVTPGAAAPWLNLVIQAFVALVCLTLGLFALVQGLAAGDLRARLVAAFSFLLAVEMSLPLDIVGDARVSEVSESLFWLITGAQIAVELHLAAVVPSRRPWLSDRLIQLFYGAGLGYGLLCWATYLVEQSQGRDFFPWDYSHVVASLNDVVLPIWAVLVLTLLAGPTFREPDHARRYQAGLVLVGILPWGLYALLNAAMALFGRQLPATLEDVFPLLVLCFPVAVFIAIYRYHLFDIELVVHRGFLYTALTSVLVLAFYLAVGALGMLLSKVVDDADHSIWAISGAMFLVGLAFGSLRRWLQRSIDSALFPARRAMHRRLVTLASELPAQGTVANMGAHLLSNLGQIFALRSSTLLLSDPKSGLFFSVASSHGELAPEDVSLSFLLTPDDPALERLREAARPLPADQVLPLSPVLAQRLRPIDARLVAPLLHNERMIGVLVLGRRLTGRRYHREEIEMLSLFAPHIATAFENIRLFESATYESLTGLLRRESILDLLDREIDRATRHGRPLVVGMADLDFFKEVNDRYGHLAGDAVLKRVAEELAAGLRSTDAVGRYGGEEFLLVLPETSLEGGSQVAEKLRQRIEELSLPLGDGASVNPRVSIGLAELPRRADRHPDLRSGLIDTADRALYRAKERGRNRVEYLDALPGALGA